MDYSLSLSIWPGLYLSLFNIFKDYSTTGHSKHPDAWERSRTQKN